MTESRQAGGIVELKSLGQKTDLIFARFAGEVVDRGEYIAIKTPSNPGYHWGNYLIFGAPPEDGDLQRWTEIFRREFPYYDSIRHLAFTWDAAGQGSTDEFLLDGFTLERVSVLTTADIVPPPKFNRDIEVRPLASDADWDEATLLQVACREPDYDEQGYLKFKQRQMEMYRRMSDMGRGHRFGAFLGSHLVADLGVFFEGAIARYQNVVTHPDFRRRGICGSLVYLSGQWALRHFGVQTLVMEADADYHAARIYESVGFIPTEERYQLGWWAKPGEPTR